MDTFTQSGIACSAESSRDHGVRSPPHHPVRPPRVAPRGRRGGGLGRRVEALREFTSALPTNFPGAVLVVLHIPPTGPSLLPAILSLASKLPARHARDGERLTAGVILVAPPDRHMAVDGMTVRVLAGPRENGHRPAADVLLRSVAEHFCQRAAGVVLSGTMDDGAAGLRAVRVAGGFCLVQMIKIDDYQRYMEVLEANPGEFAELFNTILINVTSLKRDKDAWDALALRVIPLIVDSKGPEEVVRIWSAGCASGEEAYSLAVLFADAMGEDRFRRLVKIYATDADTDALATARHGRYREADLVEAFGEELTTRFFEGDARAHWTLGQAARFLTALQPGVPVDLELSDVAAVFVPFLALVTQEEVEYVIPEGLGH